MNIETIKEAPKSRFTPEQEDAINAGGSFIIVSAAAGSGKTTVLIEKLIRLLSDAENGLRADKLIIVTFTNDAAGQIVRKLNTALNKAISSCGAEPENAAKKSWLIKQQSYLGAAKISTISSFCFNLLRSHSGVMEIPSDFRIIDESEAELMLLEAFEKTSDEHFADPEKCNAVTELFSYFRYFSKNNLNKKKKYEELLLFRSFLLAIPFYKERFIIPLINEYSKGEAESFDPYDTYYGKMLCERINDILSARKIKDTFQLISLRLKSMVNAPCFEANAKKDRSSKRATAFLDSLSAAMETLDDYYNNTKGLSQWERITRAADISCDFFRSDLSLKTQTDTAKKLFGWAELSDDYSEFVLTCRSFGRLILPLSQLPSDCTAEDLRSDYISHKHMLTLISDFIEAVNEKYNELKSEKNGLTFEDGEQLALKLLGKLCENGDIVKTDTAQKLSEEYGFVMIDEFQDSNDLQDTIFRLLSPEGTSTSEGRNMFVVGDIKQSIYNFRLANPKLFSSYLKNSELYDRNTATDRPRHILLNKNFRSSPNVINFVNMLFTHLMSEKSGGIDYDDSQKLIFSDEVWLKENAEKASHITGISPDDILSSKGEIKGLETEIMLIDSNNTPFSYSPDDGEADEDDNDINSISTPVLSFEEEDIKEKMLEAQAVALKIKRLLDSHKQLSPRDICILCPTNADAPYFEEELRQLGIKASLDNRTRYLESREISIIINFLRILDNPHNNLAMTGCLLSPLFMFSPDDLALLTILRGNGSLYKVMHRLGNADEAAIKALSEGNNIHVSTLTELSEKTAVFFDLYTRIKKRASVMSIEDTIRCIYSETEIVSVMSLYSNGAGRRANLALLPEYARSYEQNVTCGTGGIYGFISYIDAMTPNRLDYPAGSASSESDNAVAVKTIHKSKGLEYPVVFLCRAHYLKRNDPCSLWYTTDCGAAFTIYDDESRTNSRSIPASLINSSKRSELISEKIRLLYVALTRAKHKLYISGILPMSGKEKRIYRENAVPAEGIYKDFECEITNCMPDQAAVKKYSKYLDSIMNGNTTDHTGISCTSCSMLIWIIAALTAEGKLPYFGGTSDGGSTVRILAEHIDSSLYKNLCSAENNSNEETKAAEPDKVLYTELMSLSSYDSSQSFEADRIMRDIPAKLTVTEITKRSHELIYEESEYTPDKAALPETEKKKGFIPVRKISLEKKKSSKLTAAEKGTAVHCFMQYADLKELEKAIASEEYAAIETEAHRLALEGLISEVQAEYISESPVVCRRIKGFFDSELWKKYFSCTCDENILSEQPFMAKISDIFAKNNNKGLDEKVRTYYNEYYNDTFVQGIADCIIKTDNGFILIDYKTNEGKSDKELLELYSVQLILYTMIFEMIFGLPEGAGEAYIYTFGRDSDTGCTIKVPR